MLFKNRNDAGRQLCLLLQKYKDQEAVVFALPRGGVIVAAEIADYLNAPLDLILAHKIGHPHYAEYAIAAISEHGHLIANPAERQAVGELWLQQEVDRQLQEIKRKRQMYLQGRKEIPIKGKIAIIVDDGIATGLTMKAGILELKERQAKKIVAVVPVCPRETAHEISSMVDDLVAVEIPDYHKFLGAVGAYFADFDQVEDREVIEILKKFNTHP